jgi:hypothetical protein
VRFEDTKEYKNVVLPQSVAGLFGENGDLATFENKSHTKAAGALLQAQIDEYGNYYGYVLEYCRTQNKIYFIVIQIVIQIYFE